MAAQEYFGLFMETVITKGHIREVSSGPQAVSHTPGYMYNIRMAKTTKRLNPFLHHLKKVKSSISIVFGLFSFKFSYIVCRFTAHKLHRVGLALHLY